MGVTSRLQAGQQPRLRLRLHLRLRALGEAGKGCINWQFPGGRSLEVALVHLSERISNQLP